MFIPMPFCIAIMVVAMVGVLIIVAGVCITRSFMTIANDWKAMHHDTKERLGQEVIDEEAARHRVIRLLAEVHQARHPNWKIESGHVVRSWQGLADGLSGVIPDDADILTVLDGAFPHEDKAAESEGSEA